MMIQAIVLERKREEEMIDRQVGCDRLGRRA